MKRKMDAMNETHSPPKCKPRNKESPVLSLLFFMPWARIAAHIYVHEGVAALTACLYLCTVKMYFSSSIATLTLNSLGNLFITGIALVLILHIHTTIAGQHRRPGNLKTMISLNGNGSKWLKITLWAKPSCQQTRTHGNPMQLKESHFKKFFPQPGN